jgi:hypothetical protein
MVVQKYLELRDISVEPATTVLGGWYVRITYDVTNQLKTKYVSGGKKYVAMCIVRGQSPESIADMFAEDAKRLADGLDEA